MHKKLLFLILLLICPLVVSAEEIDYDLTHFHVEGYIKENGNVDICEYIGQKGTFNGYIREINYLKGDTNYAPKGIDNIRVYGYDFNNKKLLQEFTKSTASNGDSYKYTLNNYGSNYEIKMYYRSSGEERGYAICYTLKDLVLVHNDVAEIYYNVIPNGFDDVLNDIDIKFYLPGQDNDLRVWAHGPLYGEVTREQTVDNSYLHATVDELSSYTPVDIRMVFNKELVKESTRITNKSEALAEILEQEQIKADEANEQRETAKRLEIMKLIAFAFSIIVTIALIIRAYFKYDKEYEINFGMKYYRELPNTYGPEVLEYLLNKNISTLGYSSCILNLIDKHVLEVEKIPDTKNDYFIRSSNRDDITLTPQEAKAFNFLINDVGNGKQFTLGALKSYSKKTKTAKKFLNHYNSWVKTAIGQAEHEKFYEKNSVGLSITIALLLNMISGFVVISSYPILFFINLILGIGSIIYLASIKKKTKSGLLQYKQWMAFKNFLLDFGKMDEKELPEIKLWSKYLVYATVLKVARQLEKTMKIKLQNIPEDADVMSDIYLTHFIIHSNIYNTVQTSVTNAVSVSNATIASSTASSGSGYGGGFSGGGGFGGGGGGGHGF